MGKFKENEIDPGYPKDEGCDGNCEGCGCDDSDMDYLDDDYATLEIDEDEDDGYYEGYF